MTISYKKAEEQDLNIILRMMEDFNAIDHYPFDKASRTQNILVFIKNDNLGRLWLILDDLKIIGYVVLAYGFSFEFHGRDAFVDELYLITEYRSQGIGSKTMDFVYQQAKGLGVKALHLEVEHHNEKGCKLYAKQGFREHGRTLLVKMVE